MPSTPQPIEQQNTVPHQALRKEPLNYEVPAKVSISKMPPAYKKRSPAPPTKKTSSQLQWPIIIGGGLFIGSIMALFVLIIGLGIIYASDNIAPNVKAFGVDVGGLSVEEASIAIENQAQHGLILKDGEREWAVESSRLGIRVDSLATAKKAYEAGRSNLLRSTFLGINVEPVLDIDLEQMQVGLQELASNLEQPPINAAVQLVNGQVQTTPPQMGRQLDIASTIALVQQDANGVLRDGILELVMIDIPPAITDASPMVAQATQLLASPLTLQGFDPVHNETLDWSLAPYEWGQWLVTERDPASPTGLRLSLNHENLIAYLNQRNSELDSTHYLKIEEAAQAIQNALASNTLNVLIRIYHTPIQHVVTYGETLSSIAFDYGIPYGWLQYENPSVSTLSVGQTINIPSPDELIPLPIVYHKRIIISLSQQKMWAYENGSLKWEWLVSTGIASSPTSPGVFQIQSHYDNAYAGNWDLWMPYFMGIYKPVPTLDFMNGFHGFPTRGGSQLLWTNSLGTRVTYGCILLSNTNAQQLYTWAEEGVIVEIQP